MDAPKYKILLTYFRSLSGKYYSNGEYYSSKANMYQVFDEVAKMIKAKQLPGLVDGASGYHVLVDSAEHPNGYPHLFISDKKS